MIKLLPDSSKAENIRIPFSLLVYKRAIKVGVPSNLIEKLSFIDLQILILSLEIDTLVQYHTEIRKINLQKRGIKDIVKAKPEDYENL